MAAALALTIGAATAAASWPARELLALPITEALSGRPHRNTPTTTARRWAAPGLLVTGLAALRLSGPLDSLTSLLLTVAGAGLVIAATVAAGPLLIATAGRLGESASVAVRLAGRNLARHQRRSGAALGALSLIIGLAVATVVTTSSAVYSAAEGNLSARQVMLRVGEIPSSGDVSPIPERSPAEVARLDATADDIARQLDGAPVTPVDVAVIPNLDIAGAEGLPVAVLTVDEGGGFHRIVDLVYVASAKLVDRYGASHNAAPAFLTNRAETGLMLEPIRPEPVRPVRLEAGYSSVPGTFITPRELTRRGWGTARAGWLIEAEDPVTAEEFDAVRGLAAAAGITAERREQQGSLARARDAATALALLASLALVAMTVGLMRAQTLADRRILVAIGSSRRQQRDVAAATAGTLAVAAVGLGTGIAYLSLLAQTGDQLARAAAGPRCAPGHAVCRTAPCRRGRFLGARSRPLKRNEAEATPELTPPLPQDPRCGDPDLAAGPARHRPSGAARLLVEVGDLSPFPDRNHFASWTGTAPIDGASGDHVRHPPALPASTRRWARRAYLALFDPDGRPPAAARDDGLLTQAAPASIGQTSPASHRREATAFRGEESFAFLGGGSTRRVVPLRRRPQPNWRRRPTPHRQRARSAHSAR